MRILSIDPSMTALGWASHDGISTKYGTQSFGAYKQDYGMVFYQYEMWLKGMVANVKPELITFEAANAGLKGAARYLITGMEAVLIKTCVELGIKRWSMTPSQLKKALTGKGNADKTEMVGRIKTLGYSPKDDNQADAIALLIFARQKKEQQSE